MSSAILTSRATEKAEDAPAVAVDVVVAEAAVAAVVEVEEDVPAAGTRLFPSFPRRREPRGGGSLITGKTNRTLY